MNRLCHLTVAATLSITALAQPSPELQARLKGVASFLTLEMRDAGIPSLAVAVTRNGEVVCTRGFGQARPGVPADQDTPFALASISKGLTAMGLMELVEKGRHRVQELPGLHPARRRGPSRRRGPRGRSLCQRQGAERWGIAILCGKNDSLAETLDPEGSFQMRLVPGVLNILTRGGAQLPPLRAGSRRTLLLFATLFWPWPREVRWRACADRAGSVPALGGWRLQASGASGRGLIVDPIRAFQ